MTYRYRVLGATQAVRPDGTEVPLGGARLRALLGALAVGGGRPASMAQLAAQVWGEDEAPPADEVAAVQALVGRLRRVLGKEAVASVPGGYRLVAEPDDIDLFRFERLAAEGSAAIGAGDPRLAAALLDEALTLWRGPLLADLPGAVGGTSPASRGGPAAVRAERRHAQARRDRLTAEVALGRAEGALAELAALAGQEPLDEPLQALWIRALRATGRRAEALQAYEEVRLRLADRLGADPSGELRALHAELLAEDATPSPPDGSAWPDGSGAPGYGGHPGRGGQQGPGNLRPRLTTFVGREAELGGLVGELGARRLVTLMGPGGVGKTRLALEAAEAADGAWPGGVWVAELAPVRGGEAVAEAVLTALGARDTALGGPGARELRAAEGAAPGPLAELLEHCARRRMLLVLDNCEHVVGAAAELAQALLADCPGVTVLATSREPLGVPGEWVRPVEPLPPEVALRLFAERGAAVRPGFGTEDDRPACEEICRRLDGLPLAIELAAARLRALTPRQIADRLDSRFRLLTGGHRTALPRQRTLRAVVDWSWDLLDEGERTVLRRLAVFAGGCALEEAEAVCAEPTRAGGATPATLDILSSLVDKSLVLAVPEGPDGMRYRLLETVAEYAAQRLAEAGEREDVERRHLAVYRELVRTGDPLLRGPEQARWLERFEAEHDNVRAALRRAVELREEQEALCLALSMSWFWQLRNHYGDARSWAPAVAALGPDPFLAPVRPAVPLADPCTAQAPPWSEEQLWEARRGVRLMVFASDGGGAAPADGEGAQEYLRGIVDAYRPGLPQTCRQPGFLWFSARLLTGRAASLGETLDDAVRDCREFGYVWELGLVLLLRARLRYGGHPGGPERSEGDADQALAQFERAGDPWGIAESLSVRGEAYEWRGRYEEAAADFGRAVGIAARGGAKAQVPALKAKLASVRLETARDAGEEAEAERVLLQAVTESGQYAGEALDTARLILVQRLGRTGRTTAARDQLDLLEQAFPAATPAFLTGMVAGLHGWLDCLDGAYERAQGHLRRAVRSLETLAYLVAPHLIVEQFISAAWAKAHLGAAEDGARLLGAYDRGPVMEGFCFRSFSAAAEVRQRAEAELRRALDGPTYERAYAEGGGLPVEEAAALV
ncbi:putative multi-domain regulator [Streptomyces bingchenggensis BCW-1]|uniref:Putative multi-domain regulator n=1 Tax=Streptomyces bingchenggensis (strain BCW-1) TaxID=749414 RepID=D7C026_STRBB|nr:MULTISPECIES: BTAD domain-containing putative transcriptional regulator [Streptomyces]ADI12066.1 putative multi-domain regulator [Streptomyces bingchenggensis BCW-1]